MGERESGRERDREKDRGWERDGASRQFLMSEVEQYIAPKYCSTFSLQYRDTLLIGSCPSPRTLQ